jgi:hypothetical protein
MPALVSLDETAASTGMPGCCSRGEHIVRGSIAVLAGHWKTMTVVGALCTGRLSATALLDASITWERFRASVTDTLVPTLRRRDRVILDHLGAHKVAGVREVITAFGRRLH